MAKVIMELVTSCINCPMVDDMNRCSVLDYHGKPCDVPSIGIRDNCPMPDQNDDLMMILEKHNLLS